MAHYTLEWKFETFAQFLDEKQLRLFAAIEALAFGEGGATAIAAASGISRQTVQQGIRDLREGIEPESRIRKTGGGRKSIRETQPGILEALDKIIDPSTRGDPESPLRWTTKSTTKISNELKSQGFEISHVKVGELLGKLNYSLQANAKNKEGSNHPDRDAQFLHISELSTSFIAENQPVISVDTKKKELVGEFKNKGKEWHPKGTPEQVSVHDFEDKILGKAIPYGVYDVNKNEGWVSVGTDHDTAEFAVESIRQWWKTMGVFAYPNATKLLICADYGGSNSSRSRTWKSELQDLADILKLEISVCHYPPGTSKWNKIEHRLFSSIAQNWRARPLITHEVIVELIKGTTNKSGLKVDAALDTKSYETGIKITDDRMSSLNFSKDGFHGDWNYHLSPASKNKNFRKVNG